MRDNDLFDPGEIKVETLIARIRDAAYRRRQSEPEKPAHSGATEQLQSLQVDEIRQEIDSASLLANRINEIPLKAKGGLKRALEQRAKSFIKWLVHWNSKSQADFNRLMTRSMGLVTQSLQTVHHQNEKVQKSLNAINEECRRIDTLESRLMAIEKQQASIFGLQEELSKNLQSTLDALQALRQAALDVQQALRQEVDQRSREFDEIQIRLLRVERTVQDQSKYVPEQIQADSQLPVKKAQDIDFDYFVFESKFRGSLAEIKQRQSLYLPLFLHKKNVLDLGCGRGEFVELAAEHGIGVLGIDNNKDNVGLCVGRNLNVVQADIFDYLSKLPDSSLDGVASFQVIEHVDFEQILRLVSLCERKLQSKGVVVFETKNTDCPVGLSEFYIDPSHVRPVPPILLRFILEQKDFDVQFLRFTAPVQDSGVAEVLDAESGLPEHWSLYRDYAVIATRR